MDLSSVSTQDWVSVAVGVFGLVMAYLSRKDRLPSWAVKWLKRIGSDRVADAVARAASLAEMTPDQRRQEAVAYLQRLCVAELGFPVPASIANLLVEYVYQQWKRARR